MLAKFAWELSNPVFPSFWGKVIWKMSALVLGEIPGAFINTLSADGKYPVRGCENLQLPIQMQLSEREKTFSSFFVPFLESTSHFKHFEKNMLVTANVFRKLQTMKISVRPPAKKRRFRKRFEKEHANAFPKTCEISIRAL